MKQASKQTDKPQILDCKLPFPLPCLQWLALSKPLQKGEGMSGVADILSSCQVKAVWIPIVSRICVAFSTNLTLIS